jgi:hypothetical protein
VAFGNQTIINFYTASHLPPTLQDAIPGHYWSNQLDSDGAKGMAHVRELIDSRPFSALIPDQGLVTNTLDGSYLHIQCARGADYAFIYSSGGAAFTVNMGRISGTQVKAYWFNPRDGQVTFVGRFTNSGTQYFSPPGGQARGNDWLLILDDASVSRLLPGQ